MERVVRMAAQLLPASASMIALLGHDRRCFKHGSLAKPWMSHDCGVLVRSGILALTMENGGMLSVRDMTATSVDGVLRAAARDLQIVSMASVTMALPDGMVLGALCVFDEEPREWSERDLSVLRELADLSASELQLRRALAERELRERQLRHDTLHDTLTGLPNRAMFMKRLSGATQRMRRGDNGLFALLLRDVDEFTVVNDSMGHHVGDEVLVTVARRLEDCVRGGDIVSRLGGDEFAILLERIEDARDSALVAERVQQALSVPMNIGGYEHVASASIGVALSSSASEQPEYLLRSADMAMYRAKNAGRARFEMFDRAMHAEALTRLQVETDLRRAIDREEFLLHYQPIVSLSNGHIVGVEALVRWRHYERGLVAPNDFISVCEDTGLIVPLGRWVLKEASKQVRAWQLEMGDDRPFRLSVNLSVREFAQPDLARQVATSLEESGLAPQALQLEITESAIIDQAHPALATIQELKDLGVAIHLDDFGTGYSALSYLHRLPLDAVKVDRAFTTAIDSEERPLHVVRSIISLVHAIGMEVVAEGVSSPEQLSLLRTMGCDYGQGFFFSMPREPGEIGEMLRARKRW
jgi:diguanylate cyclase (GGDEF)-like protein